MSIYGHLLDVSIAIVLVLVSVALGVLMWRLLRCVHAWELVDKTELPPPIEAYEKNRGLHLTSGWLSTSQGERMSQRTLVLAMRRPKCGAARIWKTSA